MLTEKATANVKLTGSKRRLAKARVKPMQTETSWLTEKDSANVKLMD
jgi:hypothetical protein